MKAIMWKLDIPDNQIFDMVKVIVVIIIISSSSSSYYHYAG
jgi:hypothetical protein